MLELTVGNFLAVVWWCAFWVVLWWALRMRERLGVIEQWGQTLCDGRYRDRRILGKQSKEIADLKKNNLALADRVAQQSELLSKRAEVRVPPPYPPSLESALSPNWCKQPEAADGKFRAPGISEGS